ncbi:hypothetical protein A2851_00365 [Candidatus Kaiserbacteria bacterium RIFCSPHIGHO2_01_FULL_53_29]|uniref:Uncharacterized protein n=1 Tax=Candidatus Kaiserbacteria bacterium RIFCSPHIGHO2_01_FULL_53_29 TaxID=1798480 RepID=A0A1F6CU00_9BACT|nr:MAG: hypothetical protein A2851_00365 [Candidatus Kaiserbacteria bacterium RIFCSPHIGHO2_01_FULL_53_29]
MSYLRTNVRAALGLAAFLCAFFAPWWIPLVFMTLLALRWRAWEVPLLGLAMDLLFLPTIGLVYPIPFFMLFGLGIVWVFEPLRAQFLIS